eukprot:scaffold7382_cov406-Prasinococcus_capsulatus_cf.AAC.3
MQDRDRLQQALFASAALYWTAGYADDLLIIVRGRIRNETVLDEHANSGIQRVRHRIGNISKANQHGPCGVHLVKLKLRSRRFHPKSFVCAYVTTHAQTAIVQTGGNEAISPSQLVLIRVRGHSSLVPFEKPGHSAQDVRRPLHSKRVQESLCSERGDKVALQTHLVLRSSSCETFEHTADSRLSRMKGFPEALGTS